MIYIFNCSTTTSSKLNGQLNNAVMPKLTNLILASLANTPPVSSDTTDSNSRYVSCIFK